MKDSLIFVPEKQPCTAIKKKKQPCTQAAGWQRRSRIIWADEALSLRAVTCTQQLRPRGDAVAGRPLHCPDLPSMAADRISLTGNAQAQVNMGEGRGRELAGNGRRMSPWSPCVHASTP
jgi:hypothetical protein